MWAQIDGVTSAADPVDVAVVWFRRDLRLHDNPALTAALASSGRVAPLFVVDPRLSRGRFTSPNRWWYLMGSLRDLNEALEQRGSRLIVRLGDPIAEVPIFARSIGAAAVHASREPLPYGRRRDDAVAAALERDGVDFRRHRGVLIHEPEKVLTAKGERFAVFTPFRRRWEAIPLRPILPAPSAIPSVTSRDAPRSAMDGPWEAEILATLDVPGPTASIADLPAPGESAARSRLAAWLTAGPKHGPSAYGTTRDHLADDAATSRLGPDLRFGLLSPTEVAMRALAIDGGAGSRRFVSELAWRDFYAHLLWHEPRVRREAFQPRFAGVPWPGGSSVIEAWRSGMTGYPIVDAAMRQLTATGFMPNRARMIVASFLTKDLLVDWRVGEAHFMTHLLDGDPASNLGGWQWSASVGIDAQPYFRVFNPVVQARRFDSDGSYVRRWVPALRSVPTTHVHEPWTMTPEQQVASGCVIGSDYPGPIVDHADARRRAIEWFAGR